MVQKAFDPTPIADTISVTMARGAMHQTTVRFGADLWEALEREAARLGVSAAQYVRDATLSRLSYTEGVQHERERPPAWMEADRDPLRHDVTEQLDSAAAVRTQGALARERATRARAEAQRLRRERRRLAR